ncbi:MAG: hypothetical protein ACPLW8_03380 [Candidatus Bathyarchaeales archaeon]
MMRYDIKIFCFGLCIAAVALFIAFVIVPQVVAYYEETEYVYGTLAVNEGHMYGPYEYYANVYYTIYLDSVTPEPGLYIGYVNAATGSGYAEYKYPGGHIGIPHDGADYYALYLNYYPNDEAVTYTGRIVTRIY